MSKNTKGQWQISLREAVRIQRKLVLHKGLHPHQVRILLNNLSR